MIICLGVNLQLIVIFMPSFSNSRRLHFYWHWCIVKQRQSYDHTAQWVSCLHYLGSILKISVTAENRKFVWRFQTFVHHCRSLPFTRFQYQHLGCPLSFQQLTKTWSSHIILTDFERRFRCHNTYYIYFAIFGLYNLGSFYVLCRGICLGYGLRYDWLGLFQDLLGQNWTYIRRSEFCQLSKMVFGTTNLQID